MINFQLDNIQSLSFNPKDLFSWIKDVIHREGSKTGNIYYHFCDDEFLLKINREALQHDYYTDIITFPLSTQPEIISAEIYISVDRVSDNAQQLGTLFSEEMARVMIHGILHLLGYEDHTETEKKEMRAKEDYYLSLLP